MAIVATDDAARRQQFIWLGPVNSPWPFEASGRAWIMGLLLCPAFTVVAFVLAPRPLLTAAMPGPGGWLVTALTAALLGITAGVIVTRRVGRVVSATRPLKHHVNVLLMEASAPRDEQPRIHMSTDPAGLWLETRDTRVRRIDPPTFIEE